MAYVTSDFRGAGGCEGPAVERPAVGPAPIKRGIPRDSDAKRGPFEDVWAVRLAAAPANRRLERRPILKPSHGDPLVPEDHDEIKNEELLALEQEVDGLKTALGTRTLIGKAIGIIIEREGVNETEAFERLKTLSQHSNVKLRDIAAGVAREAQPAGAEEP